MKYIIQNVTNKDDVKELTLNEILEEINRDRSDEWIPYDETDWLEGLNVFTEYEVIEFLENV